MSHVALFRNLNLGHLGSPTGEELVAAFGGTGLAHTFQTNGTVLFNSDQPESTACHALLILRSTDHHHNVTVRPLSELKRVVEEAPGADPADNIYRTMISFYDIDTLPSIELPVRSRNRLVEVRRLDHRNAASVCWKPHHTAGDATGFLETLLNAPVTTRSLGTLQRLIAAAPTMGYR